MEKVKKERRRMKLYVEELPTVFPGYDGEVEVEILHLTDEAAEVNFLSPLPKQIEEALGWLWKKRDYGLRGHAIVSFFDEASKFITAELKAILYEE